MGRDLEQRWGVICPRSHIFKGGHYRPSLGSKFSGFASPLSWALGGLGDFMTCGPEVGADIFTPHKNRWLFGSSSEKWLWSVLDGPWAQSDLFINHPSNNP